MATDLSKDEINRRVDEAAKTMGIEDLLDDKPKALSGASNSASRSGAPSFANPKCSCWTKCAVEPRRETADEDADGDPPDPAPT